MKGENIARREIQKLKPYQAPFEYYYKCIQGLPQKLGPW
jgi:hypothetical protein